MRWNGRRVICRCGSDPVGRWYWIFVYAIVRYRVCFDCRARVGEHGVCDYSHDADFAGGSGEFSEQDHGLPGADDGAFPDRKSCAGIRG